MTKIWQILVLSAAALALSTLPGRAGPCAQEIDRAWAQVDAKIQARIAAGRSAPQNVIGLLHHQPTLSSIAAAQKTLGQGWTPVEVAVAALARAREADQAGDRSACDQTLAQVQQAIEPRVLMSLPWP
jgi:low affinity Fe/Cu permease